jgi:alpha-amylase/alpha-mannosidase (GH57 family)
MERYLCIHGHFYQPPRENPWLEEVEVQDSAYPYHDWNERITAECYATNSSSRILDHNLRILEIVSNYSKISFDMGPTLLAWLEKNAVTTYEAILEADRESLKNHGGHGSAMAQAYNHLILPLANSRDKRTQIIWGLKDFEARFRRQAAGMWLPETAVDLESLEIMADCGISYTILAPHQAHKIRQIDARKEEWQDVSGSRIDPTRAYLLQLPSGRTINIFFYDGPISRAVAFERLLNRGEDFAHRLLNGFSDQRQWTQLMHIATDGESYGHHHRHGEMALAYALNYIEGNKLATLINYSEFLDKFPPSHMVRIYENSSWSCLHGIERWRSDCGCNSGMHGGWHQRWRTPLRESLDWLRDELITIYQKRAPHYLRDPWAARNDYIDVIFDRSESSLSLFFEKHQAQKLTRNDWVKAIKLLEMQRNSMLMYTSCGWFFDEISGIETVQVLQYAGRALQLAQEIDESFAGDGFLELLAKAPGNIPDYGTGADVYRRFVSPAVVDLQKVGVHYAISSLFEDYSQDTFIFCYEIEKLDFRKSQAGNAALITGRCLITSEITGDSETFSFAALYLGTHDINCGIRRLSGIKHFKSMADDLHARFESGSFSDVVRMMDLHFGMHSYSLRDLFKEEQRRTLQTLIKDTLENSELAYRRLYEDNRLLVAFLKEASIPVPKVFCTAADFILNLGLKQELEREIMDIEKVGHLLQECRKWNVPPEAVDLEFALRHNLERTMDRLAAEPTDLQFMASVEELIDLALRMPFEVKFWSVQNQYYRLAKTVYPQMVAGQKADADAPEWLIRFRSIGKKLNFNLQLMLPQASQQILESTGQLTSG